MLKNVHALLTPDLIYVLAAMGHGDDLAVVDANFPSESIASRTPHGHPVRLAGAALPIAIEAVLSVFPLDTFGGEPVRRMGVVGRRDDIPMVQREVMEILANVAGGVAVGCLNRSAFYDAAGAAYAVVATGERRFYGCFLLRKGVIAPDGSI